MELIDYTLGGILEKWVREQPDHEFMIPRPGTALLVQGIRRAGRHLCQGLLAIGAQGQQGRRMGQERADWMTLMFATAKIGAVLVTVNTNYKAAELEYIMKNADIHTMCMVNGYRDSDYVQILYDLVPELKTLPRGHLHSERFPELRNVVYIGQEKQRGMYNTSELMTLGSLSDDGCSAKRKRRSAATTKSTCSTLPVRPASRKGSC
ncbi:MAG: AMP-binding protein [Alistipes sp.]